MRETGGGSIEALRAYARDVEAAAETAAPRRGAHSRANANKGPVPPPRRHIGLLLPIAAAVIVLVGAAASTAALLPNTTDTALTTFASMPSSEGSNVGAAPQQGTNAQRAVLLLSSNGLGETALAIEDLIASGTASEPSVAAAIAALHAVVEVRSGLPTELLAADPAVLAAIALLEEATRPPGLDAGRTPLGQGGTAPGQDETFTPPGQSKGAHGSTSGRGDR